MSLRPDATMGLFANRIAYLDRPAHVPDADARRVADDVARLAVAPRVLSTRRTVPSGLRDLLFAVHVTGRYRRRDCLAGGRVICAAIHAADDGMDREDSPVRMADHDPARIARWIAAHVGVRPCVAGRMVGHGRVRLVIVGVDRRISVVRVPFSCLPTVTPITRNPSPAGDEGGYP